MVDKLISLGLYFGAVCGGVAAMWVTTRWTEKQWPMWLSFIIVMVVLMALLQWAGVPSPV